MRFEDWCSIIFYLLVGVVATLIWGWKTGRVLFIFGLLFLFGINKRQR